MNAACTIISPNYLPFARALATSYLEHHPGQRFFVLVVADLTDRGLFARERFESVLLCEIGLEDLRDVAMKYDILELNTNVKPAFLQYLFRTYDVEQLVYLDPDIRVYSSLAPVFAALSRGAAATLTPHLTTPITDNFLPSEQDHLYNGTYNLGFAAFRRCAEADRILVWWNERCLALGFSEGRTGLFVDQKWMNLAPGLFEGVAILRDAGCNMAYWNLHERSLDRSMDDSSDRSGGELLVHHPNGPPVPLRFFHFSGIDVGDDEGLSRNTNRFQLRDRPDLQALFAEYRRVLRACADQELQATPYGFDRLSDGTVVTRLARRIYAKHQARWNGQNPFDARGDFAAFARRLGLVAGKVAPGRSTWKEFNPRDRRVRAVHRALKLALRVLGPHRYELLMRYLAYIAVLRNQSVFLDERRDGPSANG